MTRELCSPTVALVLLRHSEISTPVIGYTVGSTDSSLSGKTFMVTLSFRYTLTNSKVQLFAIPLCCTVVMPCFSHKDAFLVTLKFIVICSESALGKPLEDAGTGTASSGLWLSPTVLWTVRVPPA